MSIVPGIDSIYIVATKTAIKNAVNAVPDLSLILKNILNKVTKRSIYIWWSDNDTYTADGRYVLEIPKNILKAQTYILNNYANKCYTKETIRPLILDGKDDI